MRAASNIQAGKTFVVYMQEDGTKMLFELAATSILIEQTYGDIETNHLLSTQSYGPLHIIVEGALVQGKMWSGEDFDFGAGELEAAPRQVES